MRGCLDLFRNARLEGKLLGLWVARHGDGWRPSLSDDGVVVELGSNVRECDVR